MRLEGLLRWKKFSALIENRTLYLPPCSIVFQLTTLPRVPRSRQIFTANLSTNRFPSTLDSGIALIAVPWVSASLPLPQGDYWEADAAGAARDTHPRR